MDGSIDSASHAPRGPNPACTIVGPHKPHSDVVLQYIDVGVGGKGIPEYSDCDGIPEPCQACREDHGPNNNHPDFETEDDGDSCGCCFAHHGISDALIRERDAAQKKVRELEAENWRRMEHGAVRDAEIGAYRRWIWGEVFEGRLPRSVIEQSDHEAQEAADRERFIDFPARHGTFQDHMKRRQE